MTMARTLKSRMTGNCHVRFGSGRAVGNRRPDHNLGRPWFGPTLPGSNSARTFRYKVEVQVQGLFICNLTVAYYAGGIATEMDGIADRLAHVSFCFGCYNIVCSAGLSHDGFPATWCPHMDGHQSTVLNARNLSLDSRTRRLRLFGKGYRCRG